MDDLAKGVGKAFKESADSGVLKSLKQWWKSPAKSGIEIEKMWTESSFDDIVKSLDIERADKTGRLKGVLETLGKATAGNKSLRTAGGQISSKLEAEARELGRLKRILSIKEGKLFTDPEEMEIVKKYTLDVLHRQINEIQARIIDLTKHRSFLMKIQDISLKQGPDEALRYVQQDPDFLFKYPDIQQHMTDWISETTASLQKWHQSYKLMSSNLDNQSRFLKELKIYSKRSPEFLKSFLEQPQNKGKLESLKMSGSFFVRRFLNKILAPADAVRPSLTGSIMDIATKLGIAAGSIGAGIAGVKVYNWFDSNSPGKVANDADTLEASLRNIKVTGEGALIVNNAYTSLDNISRIAAKVHAELGENPEKAAAPYITQISKELVKLSAYLSQWDKVVSNSSDKEQVIAIGKKLESFITTFNNSLKDLGKQVGVSVNSLNISPIKKPSLKISEIEQIQRLLNKQGYNIPVTGKVDESTISALEALERQFPEGRTGKDITGSFVNRSTGSIISYNDLVNALNILEK